MGGASSGDDGLEFSVQGWFSANAENGVALEIEEPCHAAAGNCRLIAVGRKRVPKVCAPRLALIAYFSRSAQWNPSADGHDFGTTSTQQVRQFQHARLAPSIGWSVFTRRRGMREWWISVRPISSETSARRQSMKTSTAFKFRLAATIFYDSNLVTVADVAHSETEDRWFSVGIAANGVLLSVVYLWSEADPAANFGSKSDAV